MNFRFNNTDKETFATEAKQIQELSKSVIFLGVVTTRFSKFVWKLETTVIYPDKMKALLTEAGI